MAKFSKLFKFNYNFSPILHNCFVLYFLLLLAIVQIVYFAGVRDVTSLVTLLIIGFLTTFFNKNMTIVLFLALVITNLLKYGVGSRYEGFEGKDDEKQADKKYDDEKNGDKKNEDDKHEDNEKKTSNKDKEAEKSVSEKVDEQYENLKEEYPKFKVVQQEILSGVQKMAPLLEKAEKFIDKFDAYKTGKMKESFSKH